MMNTSNTAPISTLAIFMANTHIGTLHNEDPLAFSYAPEWLANPTATPIEPNLPLQAQKITVPFVLTFFENLLPEGQQRKYLSLHHHASSIFGMLAAVGGDTAGSIILLPSTEQTNPPALPPQLPTPQYHCTTWEHINKLLHGEKIQPHLTSGLATPSQLSSPQNINDPPPRRTLSGAQQNPWATAHPRTF
jgi:serine/threonine-protein kinase HipA